MKQRVREILSLPLAERIRLVGDIWDSIAAEPDRVPVSLAQRRELDRRRRAHATNPGAARPWKEIRARLQGR